MQTRADEQRVMVRRILTTAMAVLRDDQPFDPKNIAFGRVFDSEEHYPEKGLLYSYANDVVPSATIQFSTGDDPEDYDSDRSKVKIVPAGLVVRLSPMLDGMPHTEIESLLKLERYWVDSNGVRHEGNEIAGRTPDAPNVQVYRYRAKATAESKFPVDVELFYVNPVDGSSPSKLTDITIRRAYKFLAPEEREQRRLEQQQAKRQKYGEMNLCTGMLCPETGMWQGFSESNAADVTVVWKGQKFPSVRTLTHQQEREQRRPTSWVAGQWMWLRELDDNRSQANDKGI
ncbi:hypothetical protein [Burkholderia sp. BE17]|uniref:hypothetical protein n=1 Tax=Burkholderia sp. BE17 TaxID=2656644 RepID=UPI0014071C7D|nr:hypothetical protein [Burkholderia sp. BE17]MPV65616.1 hypothetical protein [Burkholderia sp. BE17]